MATKPTKSQVKARDIVADALLLIAEAARLNGRVTVESARFKEIAARLQWLSVFSMDEVTASAIERRGLALGLAPSTAEILTLADTNVKPLDMLLLDDDSFRAMAARLDEELSEV